MKDNMLPDALDYAARGWNIVPLHTPVNGHCTCGDKDCSSIGKHPRTRHGYKEATTDTDTIKLWFEMWPNANVGIATGSDTGIFTIDDDPRNGGMESFYEIVEKYGKFPETVESLTGGGGFHLWFKHPGFRVKNIKLAQGIEIKGDGGLIVAPHSLHKSGNHYDFEVSSHPDDVEIALPPDWLIERLTPKPAEKIEFVPRQKGKVPRLAAAILSGNTTKKYKSQSEAEEAAITSLINSGFDFDSILNEFKRTAHPETHFYKSYKTKGAQEAERWLKLSYDNAMKFVMENEHESQKIARAWKVWALSVAWPSRNGAYQQLTLFAHLRIVERAGRIEYQAGQRELAEMVGCNRRAISKANKELVRKKIIECTKPHDKYHPQQSNLWKVLQPPEGVTKGYHSQKDTSVSEWYANATPEHDTFRRGFTIISKKDGHTYKVKGLGKSAAQIWQQMQTEKELTAFELATRTGRSKRTVKRMLEKMQKLGMVTFRIESALVVKWRANVVDLDQIAKKLNVAGWGARQKERHESERRKHEYDLKKGANKK